MLALRRVVLPPNLGASGALFRYGIHELNCSALSSFNCISKSLESTKANPFLDSYVSIELARFSCGQILSQVLLFAICSRILYSILAWWPICN